MSAPANKIKIQKSNSAEAQPVLFGLMSRVRKNNKWSFRVNWGRIAILIAVLALLAWTAVSATIYFVFKYSKGFDDMTVYDAAVAPFDMKAHREKVGNYNIEKALNILKSGKMSDFNEAFMNLAMGINRAPKNVEGRLQLSRIYVAMGRPDIAIQKLEQGIMYSKDNLDFIRLYMRLLLDRMEDTKIIAVGEKLLAGGKGVEVENQQVRAYIAMSMSSVYAMHGNYKKSEEYLKKYGLEKSLPGILRLSKNQWEMGNRDEAIKIIKDNFQYPSEKNPMYALLVNYYTAMGDIETARRYSVLRQAEDPFSATQKLELIRLLEKSGDAQSLSKMLDEYFELNKGNNVAMIHLANYAADKGDIKMMRKIYDNAIRQAFPSGTYCLLLLETMITNGDYAGAVKFSEDILKGKPSWTKRYEDVLSAIRSIAYYATGNANMSNILLYDVLKRSRISPKVLVATARRYDRLNAPMVAHSILEHAVNKFPRYQMALIRLVQNEIKIGDSTNIDKHILRLLQMRRPPRELITDVFNSLSSDRFIFVRDRKKILDEIESLKANNSSESFSDVIPEDENLHDDSSMMDL